MYWEQNKHNQITQVSKQQLRNHLSIAMGIFLRQLHVFVGLGREMEQVTYLTTTVCFLANYYVSHTIGYILGFKKLQCSIWLMTRPCICKALALFMLSKLGVVSGGGHRLVVKEGIVVVHPRLSAASIIPGLSSGAVRNRVEWTVCVQEPAKMSWLEPVSFGKHLPVFKVLEEAAVSHPGPLFYYLSRLPCPAQAF